MNETFLWGAAVSSHQVEGDNDNDWSEWERAPGHIADGSTSGRAAAWWAGCAEDDLSRAASLGLNAIRTSLEWSRLEPEPGRFDRRAFDRYRAIFSHAKELGLSLLVTINHFTLPRWVARLGGWTHPNLPFLFEGLAERVVRELAPHVDLWATLNEPSVLAWMSYGGKRWPPGRGSLRACFVAMRRMLDAHVLGYRAIHRVLPDARVGIVLNIPFLTPSRATHRLDRAIAATQDWAFSGAMLHALRTGWLLPPLAPGRVEGLASAHDWIGLNYYGRYDVRFDPRMPARLFGRHVQEPTVRTEETDWGRPWPEGMRAGLERLRPFGVPLYVTENGICDADDRQRPHYLLAHAEAIEKARRDGLDLRGYFHWSLVDNFEWAEGWSARFGLFELDPQTQARRPRPSAERYAALARPRG